MHMTYHFPNLEALADHFASLASSARVRASRATKIKDKGLERREAYAWDAAAQITRQTILTPAETPIEDSSK